MVRQRSIIISVIVFISLVCTVSAQYTGGASWKLVGELKVARAQSACVAVDGQRVLVLGGYLQSFQASDAAELITVNGEQISVERLPDMIAPHAESPAFMLGDTAVVIFGGYSYNMSGGVVESYSFATKKWRLLGELLVPRRQHAVTRISQDEFLVVGGRHSDLSTMSDAEIFNVRTGESRAVRNYPNAINGGHGNVTSTDVPYIAGGRDGGPNGYRSPDIYKYDKTNDRWLKIGSIGPSGLEIPSYARLRSGQAAVIGGSEAEEPLRFTCRVILETAGTFAEVACLPERVIYTGVAEWSDHTLVVAGGINDAAQTSKNSAIVDLRNRRAVVGPSLNQARRYTRAVSVRSSAGGESGWSVLCIGGFDPQGRTMSSIEMLVEGCEGGIQTDVQTSPYSVAVGSATIGDKVAMLTDTTQYSSGAIWAKSKIAVADGFASTFRFRISDGNDHGQIDGSDPGADGVAFVIQHSSDRPLGKPGEGIGYEDITNSVAIEFDTYLNAHYSDPNGSHAAVQSNGTGMNKPWHQPPYQRALQVLPVNLVANVSYYAKVEYTPGALTVYFAADPTNSTTPPTFGAPLITLSPFDLSDLIDLDANGAAWLGITSATGRSSERHYIDAWSIEGCARTTTAVDEDRTALEPVPMLQPNPATEFVTVSLPSSMSVQRVVVIDLAGRIVHQLDGVQTQSSIEIAVGGLATGQYLVRVEGSSTVTTLPLVVIR